MKLDTEALLAKVAERGIAKTDLGLTKQDLVDVLMDAIEHDRPFVIGVGDTEHKGALVLPSNDQHFEWWAQVMRTVADKHLERWSEEKK